MAGPLRSRRLLALAPDERLVEQIRRGNDDAFETVYERYAAALLAFCRHMLRSREEAEDAVQLTFAGAHTALLREPERAVALKPWLFAIARNRCLSMLRARREQPAELPDLPTDGLTERVEKRAELGQLVADVRELPDEQRAALLLAEVGGLSHAHIADVLGCEVARVKALVFRARSALIDRRRAREAPCTEIQEQLATLGGGPLRRTPVRLHLRECAACRTYKEEVRDQRRMLAAALPVAPTAGLKSSVLAGLGLGGGAAGGGIAAGLSSVAGAFGGGVLAKVAIVGALAGTSAVAVPAIVDSGREAQVREADASRPPSREAPAGGPTVATPAQSAHRQPSSPTARRRGPDGRGRRARSGSPHEGLPAGLVHKTSPRATPPGQARRADGGKASPPGQAKKDAASAVPPGQAQRPKERTAPPGQAKKSQQVPVGGGADTVKGTSGANHPKVKPPSRPAPTAKDPPAAPPAAEPVSPPPPAAKPKKVDPQDRTP